MVVPRAHFIYLFMYISITRALIRDLCISVSITKTRSTTRSYNFDHTFKRSLYDDYRNLDLILMRLDLYYSIDIMYY